MKIDSNKRDRIVMGCGLDGQILFLVGARNLSGAHPSSYLMCTGGFFPDSEVTGV
jgi:hypothetical protein